MMQMNNTQFDANPYRFQNNIDRQENMERNVVADDVINEAQDNIDYLHIADNLKRIINNILQKTENFVVAYIERNVEKIESYQKAIRIRNLATSIQREIKRLQSLMESDIFEIRTKQLKYKEQIEKLENIRSSNQNFDDVKLQIRITNYKQSLLRLRSSLIEKIGILRTFYENVNSNLLSYPTDNSTKKFNLQKLIQLLGDNLQLGQAFTNRLNELSQSMKEATKNKLLKTNELLRKLNENIADFNPRQIQMQPFRQIPIIKNTLSRDHIIQLLASNQLISVEQRTALIQQINLNFTLRSDDGTLYPTNLTIADFPFPDTDNLNTFVINDRVLKAIFRYFIFIRQSNLFPDITMNYFHYSAFLQSTSNNKFNMYSSDFLLLKLNNESQYVFLDKVNNYIYIPNENDIDNIIHYRIYNMTYEGEQGGKGIATVEETNRILDILNLNNGTIVDRLNYLYQDYFTQNADQVQAITAIENKVAEPGNTIYGTLTQRYPQNFSIDGDADFYKNTNLGSLLIAFYIFNETLAGKYRNETPIPSKTILIHYLLLQLLYVQGFLEIENVQTAAAAAEYNEDVQMETIPVEVIQGENRGLTNLREATRYRPYDIRRP